MNKRSAAFHRMILVLSAVAVFGAAAWTAMQLFEAVPAPFVPPPKAHVRFNPRADIRNNALFNTLQAVLRGDVEPGVLGRPNPFVGPPGTGGVLAPGQSSGLGSVEEVSLGGGQALAIARASDGAMLVLIGGRNANGEHSYEVRRYGTDGLVTTVGQWDLEVPGQGMLADALAPVAMQQDGRGRIWFLSKGGSVGWLQSGGTPLWGGAPVFTVSNADAMAQAADMALDGAGRLWLTDQRSVYVGDETGFQPVDVKAQLDETATAALNALSSNADITESLKAQAANPRRLQTLADGRMGIITPFFAEIIPLTQGRADTVTALTDPIGVSVALSATGELWSMAVDGEGYIRRSGSDVLAFTDLVVLPKQALENPLLMAAGTNAMFALDYDPSSTILWRTVGDEWVAEIMAASGTQPTDVAERIEVDGAGNVWAILKQRGLLLAKPAAGRL